MNIPIVGGPDIQTGLLTEFQGHVVAPIQFRLIFQKGITERAIRMLAILIILREPIGVGERSATIQYLLRDIARYVGWNTLQIILRGSAVNHVHDTRVSARCSIYLSACIVYGESCLQHVVDSPVNQSARSPTVHAGGRNHTVLMGVAKAERITCLAGILRNVDSGILCEAGIEEIAYVVVYRRTYPSRAVAISCAGVCRVIVHSIVSVAVAAVIRVIGQFADFRTPSSGVGGAV